jgi:antitoxin VapB
MMALNIKNKDVERLLDEVVEITGETKTEAVRRALEERRRRLALRGVGDENRQSVRVFLENEIWPQIPADQLGATLTKAEEESILGAHAC